MIAGSQKLLRVMGEFARDSDGDVSLESLACRTDWSAAHFQRRFKGFAGESPKAFTQRLRLDGAATELRSSRASILEVALGAGFASHEVFTRAFRRRFGCSPQEFRAAARLEPQEASRYREIVRSVSPCVRLYRVSLTRNGNEEKHEMPTSAIERRVLAKEQPILFIRRRIPLTDLQRTMGECFGVLYGHGQRAGLPIAGAPIARYVSTGAGLWTVDLAMPLIAPAAASGEIQSGVLVAGPVAFAVHEGPYDDLPKTNAAIERWIEDQGYGVGGAPWESYVTDPGQTPNPADWRTEVFWPLGG
jgi:AraC family transcriptional regulator